jgi:hypothetical protein
MNNHYTDSESLNPGSPPRRSGTPPGYRNVRLLAPLDLHWRLSAYAVQSKMNIPTFVLATLHNATPSTLPIGSRGSSAAMEGPTIDGPGLAVDPRHVHASPTTTSSAPGQFPESGSTDLLPPFPGASSTQPPAIDQMSERRTTHA